jgi:hypothetical protein
MLFDLHSLCGYLCRPARNVVVIEFKPILIFIKFHNTQFRQEFIHNFVFTRLR